MNIQLQLLMSTAPTASLFKAKAHSDKGGLSAVSAHAGDSPASQQDIARATLHSATAGAFSSV